MEAVEEEDNEAEVEDKEYDDEGRGEMDEGVVSSEVGDSEVI